MCTYIIHHIQCCSLHFPTPSKSSRKVIPSGRSGKVQLIFNPLNAGTAISFLVTLIVLQMYLLFNSVSENKAVHTRL